MNFFALNRELLKACIYRYLLYRKRYYVRSVTFLWRCGQKQRLTEKELSGIFTPVGRAYNHFCEERFGID